jgi:hypothetical protein
VFKFSSVGEDDSTSGSEDEKEKSEGTGAFDDDKR